ncbi:MAG: BamA/TamA family outer membrane protein [Cyclobacteriaceae bacterium]|nr:BamA/TamA family outer membrane protein [Cyclobacteriaceae bacterium]
MTKTVSKYTFFFILSGWLLSSCLGIKHLKDGEKLLYQEGVKAPKNISKDDLSNLFEQTPNRKLISLPIAPLVGMYYFGLKNFDSTKIANRKERKLHKFDSKIAETTKARRIANLQFRKQKKADRFNNRLENGNNFMQWGEPVAVFDSSKVTITQNRIKDYLFNLGYFNNAVTNKTSTIGKFVYVTYKAEPGIAYTIDSVTYKVKDSIIHNLLLGTQQNAFIRKGKIYQSDDFTKERERIDLLLKDNGFFDFSRQYIEFEVDTALLKNQGVMVSLLIRDPAERNSHKQFMIDSVRIGLNAGVITGNSGLDIQRYKGRTYFSNFNQYKLKVLHNRIFLDNGQLYNRSNTLLTQRQLASLDAFKFVNINYDTSGGKFIANIFTSPLERYEWSNEVGVNVTQGLPGPFYNLNFKKRNIFRGLENFDINGRIGFEGVASAASESDIYRSVEASLNASLTFPRFIFPLKEKLRVKFNRYNPKTRVTLGYGYTDRPEYRRSSANASVTYNWQRGQSHFYSFALANLSVIDSRITQNSFQDFLTNQETLGNFSLSNSFKPSFVSSMQFTFTWNPDNYGNAERSSHFLRTSIESGGNIFSLIDSIPFLNRNLAYFKFVRLTLDMRRITVLTKQTVLATRLNFGLAYSFNDNKSLPYEKFFFAGGSNSVRAWRPRRLGPGSFKPPLAGDPAADGLYSYQIEQPGEVLIEGSIELRRKLFGFFSGAIFVDAGNVWTRVERKADEGATSPGSAQFDITEFYKQIAVGTGFGFRFDFSFLILRLDIGMKMIDPAREGSDKFVLDNVKFFKPFSTNREPILFNIGIGYPF